MGVWDFAALGDGVVGVGGAIRGALGDAEAVGVRGRGFPLDIAFTI